MASPHTMKTIHLKPHNITEQHGHTNMAGPHIPKTIHLKPFNGSPSPLPPSPSRRTARRPAPKNVRWADQLADKVVQDAMAGGRGRGRGRGTGSATPIRQQPPKQVRVRRGGAFEDIIMIILEVYVAFKVYMSSETNNHR